MDNNIVMVKSASDCTLVINIPDMPLHKTWQKRGSAYPFDRKVLEQAYYTPSVEYLFKNGLLVTDDKQFLKDVGLITEDDEELFLVLNEQLMNRMIKLMPIPELKKNLAKLSSVQLDELGEYAVAHYADLSMDRIDILSNITRKNLLKAIENYKAAEV